MSEPVYLDYNASAPLRPQALTAMQKMLCAPHNASSVHSFGREGRMAVETARESVATLCGAPDNMVIFNSGATESNNTVLKFFAKDRVLISAIEHPSVLEALPNSETIPVTSDGIVDLGALENLLKQERAAVVSVMMVNNETGVIQPVKDISDLAHKHGALFHCDGVQAAGRIPLNMGELGIDFLSLSAHKIGGPQGVGALCLGLCGITPTLLHGGGQEKSARAGTENVAGIVGFGAAAEAAQGEMVPPGGIEPLSNLRDQMEKRLAEISPELIFHGQNTSRVAGTSMFSLPGTSSETLLIAFDLEGIAVSNGSACSSGTVKTSHVLEAMGCPPDIASSGIRISMGWNTKENDINCLLDAWTKIYTRIQEKQKGQTANA